MLDYLTEALANKIKNKSVEYMSGGKVLGLKIIYARGGGSSQEGVWVDFWGCWSRWWWLSLSFLNFNPDRFLIEVVLCFMFYDNYWLDINKHVDPLAWSYSILTKVFSSRLANATALDTCLVMHGWLLFIKRPSSRNKKYFVGWFSIFYIWFFENAHWIV